MYNGKSIRVTTNGYVVELCLDRPELLNRFDADVHDELPAAIDEIARASRSTDVRAVIVCSTGSVFSAGGDFDFMKQAREDVGFLLDHSLTAKRIVMALLDLEMPTIAAVQGAAIGLGATIALTCDMVVASRNVRIADPHVNIGLVAGDGGCLVWPAAVGIKRASRYLLTGDRLDADTAYQFGLVTDLVERPVDVLPAARELAAKVARLPPLAVQGTKRSLANVMRARSAEVFDMSLAYELVTTLSDDILEAIDAFKEGRPGNYKRR